MGRMVMMGYSTGTTNTTDTQLSPPNTSAFHDFLGESQEGWLYERISCSAPKSDPSGTEMSNRLVGNKRNNSDPSFMASSRDGFPQRNPEGFNVMKMLRSTSGGERSRISRYDGPLQGALQMRADSSPFMMQPTMGNNANVAKPESLVPNCMNVGGSSPQYYQSVGHASSLAYQVPLSRSRDGSSGPSVLSQLAVDEGSRTGKKGSGIFSPVNATDVLPERNSSVILPSGSKMMPLIPVSVPESFNPSSRSGLISSSRQMTIIYGGQVHVFDDVHPNKADIIMALAGSCGGSWCTNLPKSLAGATTNDSCLPIGENETSVAGDSSLALKCHKEFHL